MALVGQCDYISGLIPRLEWEVCLEKISSSSLPPSDNPSFPVPDLQPKQQHTAFSQQQLQHQHLLQLLLQQQQQEHQHNSECFMPGNCPSPPTMSWNAVTSELAIRDLVGQFAQVTLDPSIDFVGLWAPDAVWSLTEPFPNEAHGIDEIVALAGELGGGWEFFVQFVHSGTVNVNVKDKRATGRWTIQEVARGPRFYNNYAIYDDVYEIRNGKWVFAERHYNYIWHDNSEIPGDAFPVTLPPQE